MNINCLAIFREMVFIDFIIGIPKVYWFGDWEDKTVMVMEILGYNLEELFGLVNRRFSLKTQLMLIDQMVVLFKISILVCRST